MQMKAPATLAALMALASAQVMAVPVTESFSYDGSYVPTSVTPPAGQTTWQQFTSGAGTITPNSPTPGVANFNDPDDGRISIFKLYSDAAFIANPGNFQWEYSSRHRINASTGPVGTSGIFMGVRDEGGNGKTAMLGFNSNAGTLAFHNNTNGLVQTINAGDFRDGRFHDYRVVKFIDPSDSLQKVAVLIDGVVEGSPILYSALPDDGSATNGFGYYSPSAGNTSSVFVDNLAFGAAGKLPEFVASYNGTYAPNIATPPITQTTWTVFNNINAANLTPNAVVGSARFNDNITGGRLAINDVLTDTPLADQAWRYQARLRIDTAAQSGQLAYVVLGVRDEGVVGGKSALLGLFDSQLFFVDNGTGINANSILLANVDLRGGTLFHDLIVEKLLIGNDYFMQVYLDGIALLANPLAYTDLPDAVGTGNGFGYFSSTPGTSNILLDTLALQILVIPEPATMVLLLTGVPMMFRRRRHV